MSKNTILGVGGPAMPDSHLRARLTPATRTLQVIVGTMVVGALIFLVIACTVEVQQPVRIAEEPPGPIVTYVATGFGAFALIASFLVPATVVSLSTKRMASGRPLVGVPPGQQAQDDVGLLCAVHAQKTIIGCAMLEGAALLAVLAYMVEKQAVAAAVALVLIAVLASRIPTTLRLQYWIQERLRRLEAIRSAP